MLFLAHQLGHKVSTSAVVVSNVANMSLERQRNYRLRFPTEGERAHFRRLSWTWSRPSLPSVAPAS